MKRRLYSIRDTRVGIYGSLSFMDNDAAAIRAFGDLVTHDDKSVYALHPTDFAIYFMGEFDLETGEITQTSADCRVLATGSDFVKEK